MATSEQVIIVGGGIAGVGVAAWLAQSGIPVILLESGELGGRASTRNQGWLHSGAFFAVDDLRLARLCWRSMQQTLDFCPRCVEPLSRNEGLHHRHVGPNVAGARAVDEGMYYVFSHVDSPVKRWTQAWAEAGFSFEEVQRDEFLHALPSVNPDLIKHIFLLPDRIYRPDLLIEELSIVARNAGAEIRSGTKVSRVIVEGGDVRGVVTTMGEELSAVMVVLSTGGLTESEFIQETISFRPGQPLSHRVAMKTHVVSVRPELCQHPFVLVDHHGFNHIPHEGTSVFQSGIWKLASRPDDSDIDGVESEALWKDVERLFPSFDRAQFEETREWAGTTIQALGVDQITPGIAPRPTIIDHATEGGPRNLWSVIPGRATLWPYIAEEMREKILNRFHRLPLTSASPPWRS
jgi:glycine/D-amino acid oxidase-like deaminating enzyme